MNQSFAATLPGISADDSLILLRTVADRSFNSVLITHANQNIVYANPAFCGMCGYSLNELVGQNPRILQGPLTDPRVIDRLRQALANHEPFSGSTINYRKNGQPYVVEWNISPILDSNGTVRFYISVQKDITHLKAEQNTSDLFLKTIDATCDGIFITDADGTIEFANRGFEIITGYSALEVIGQKPSILKSGRHEATFYTLLWQRLKSGQPFQYIAINRHKNGQEIHCQQTITPVQAADGTITHFISVIRDLSDLVFEQLRLKEQASHDALTGLLNRRAGQMELDVAFMQAQEHKTSFSLLMLDIDNFKAVNDTYGHDRGDDVIKTVAGVMTLETRKTDKCIRWGGEEFVVLLPFCGQAKALDISESIRKAVAAHRFPDMGPVTVSIGLVESKPDDTQTTLLERADKLLYASKRLGKNRVSSDQALHLNV